MHLINDRFLHWPLKRPITLPVIIRHIDDNRSHRSRHVVLRAASIRAIPDGVGVAQSIGIDENLVSIEAVPRIAVGRPVYAERVRSAGRQLFYENMPEVEGLVDVRIELDDLNWRRGVVILK